MPSTSPEIGTVKEEVDANDVEGGSLKISFNSKYMMDALKAIDNDEVEVEFFGTMKPFILKPKGDDFGNAINFTNQNLLKININKG